MFSVVFLIAAVVCVWAVGQTWLIKTAPGTTGCATIAAAPATVATNPADIVAAKQARETNAQLAKSPGCYTGWNVLSTQDVNAANTVVGSFQAASTARIPTLFGMPATSAFLLLAAAFAAFAAFTRNGTYLFGTAVCWWMSNQAMAETKTALLYGQPVASVQFSTGINATALLATMLAAVAVAAGVFIVKTNHAARKAHAAKTGGDATPGALSYTAKVLRLGADGLSARDKVKDDA